MVLDGVSWTYFAKAEQVHQYPERGRINELG